MEKEIRNIINEHKTKVRGVIRSITGSCNEDLEQEVYIRTWKNLGKYQDRGRFAQWVKTVSANISRDFLRSKAFRQDVLKDSDDEKIVNIQDYRRAPEEVISGKERQKTILKAINSLKNKHREVILLFEIEELSLDDISKKINCPTGTVKSRLYNARKELAEILKDLL